jgi:hypothetical protein
VDRGQIVLEHAVVEAEDAELWQELDDPNLLRHAARARDVGRNPRVTGYRSEYGPSASYYAWIAAGRPVHGVKTA